MLFRLSLIFGLLLLPAAALWTSAQQPAKVQSPTPAPVVFNRDIRPLLSDNCFNCHGPDNSRRKANLRLDQKAAVFGDRGGYRVIVPGKPDESELLARVLSKDPREIMPPPKSGHQLTATQKALLRRWVAEGAPWQEHWSFVPPARPPLPPVQFKQWPRNPIDHFVLAGLEKHGLKPAPEADRATLLRRVSFDLTGLPPTPAEVDAFVNDASTNAYEKVVDRLLASPRYGERMAYRWLDAARYADTSGYQNDGERVMWRWRDWVIDAYNRNLPFDRFTIEQLAGDLLPGATLEQKIATGFNRNHRGNSEGGVIPEEFQVEYVVDRVDTTFTVWLGLTMGCARCHDHKYDPLTQREFYQVFAYFNNVPEHGKARKYGNSPPFLKSPTPAQQRQLQDLDARQAAARLRFQQLQPALRNAQRQWETSEAAGKPCSWSPAEHLVHHFPLGKEAFDGQRYRDLGDAAGFGFFDRFSLSLWVKPANLDAGPVLSRMAHTDRAEGYLLAVRDGSLQVQFVKRWLDDAIRVETAERLAVNEWQHVAVIYDGSRLAAGIQVYVNGRLQKLKIHLDDINQNFKTAQPLRLGAGGGGRFHGALDELRVYDRMLSPNEALVLATPEPVSELAARPAAKRTVGQQRKLDLYYLLHAAPEPVRRAHEHLRRLERERDQLWDAIPTTMVMQEMPTPRATHVLLRGEYDKKGPRVQPGLPVALPPLPLHARNDRLGFAQWLVRPDHPLTARVAVNRAWQLHFGTGLVKTVEDFGAQGAWPSHPELLDWLATEFMLPSPPSGGEGSGVRGWNLKKLHRLIVTSATYRQSSKVSPALRERDPDNRLLRAAHGSGCRRK